MNTRRFGTLLFTALTCSVVAQAQSMTSGAVTGRVTKSGGAPLAGATVILKNVETGVTRKLVTDDKGAYSASLLATGAYEITVTSQGMKSAKQAVSVALGNASVANFQLDSAAAEAVVMVLASAASIDTTQVNTVANVDQKIVESVPLVTRNFTDMARLSPGVVQGTGSGTTPKMVVEGARQIFNAIQIDGASNNSAFFNEQRGGVYTPFIFGADSIKELQVITNGFDVQYGQAGATVNAITKSGTNEFTGTALYERRQTSWSAKPKAVPYDPAGTFNNATNLQRFNDSYNFNVNFGGPIIKDKLWFFAGVERFHKAITSNPSPTPISAAAGMTQTDFDNMLGSKLGQVVTNRQGLTLAQEFGNPGKGIAAHSYPMENTNTVYLARFDYSLNEFHRFVLRCNYQTMEDTYLNTSAVPNNAESNNIPTKTNSISWVVEANNIWTNEIFSESRLQFAREARPMRNNAAPGIPSISIPTSTTYMAFGTKTSTPRESNELTTQFFNATTWTHGDLQVKVGMDYLHVDEDNQFFQNNAGAWNFGTYGAANEWANGTLGATNTGAISYSGAVSSYFGRIPMWTKTLSFFAQGQYSGLLNKRLVLTAGLRTTNQSFSNNPHPNPNFQGLDQGFGNSAVDPRFGFSWDVDGKGTTVVRGGLGQFTSPTPLLLHSNTMTGNGQIITNYGFTLDRSKAGILALFNSGILSASNLISGTALRKASDAELATIAGGGLFSSGASSTSLWDPENKLSRSRKANLGIEHDFGNNLVVGLSGTYVKYDYLQRFENINLGQVGGTAYNDGYAAGTGYLWNGARPNYAIIRGRRVDFTKGDGTPGHNPTGGFSDVYLVKSDGWGYYRGVSVTVKKTWNERTGFFANLTYAKSYDTGSFERGTYTSASTNFSSELGASLTPDPQNPGSNYGFGDNDRRWVLNAVAYCPTVFGIQASVRILFQTGLPFTAYDQNKYVASPSGSFVNGDVNGDGMANHVVAGHVRNDLRQPSYTQFDLRLSRNWKIYKQFEIEGIIDIYNLFNKADYTVPSPNGYWATTAGTANASPAFGQLATVNKEKTREMQAGVRLKF